MIVGSKRQNTDFRSPPEWKKKKKNPAGKGRPVVGNRPRQFSQFYGIITGLQGRASRTPPWSLMAYLSWKQQQRQRYWLLIALLKIRCSRQKPTFANIFFSTESHRVWCTLYLYLIFSSNDSPSQHRVFFLRTREEFTPQNRFQTHSTIFRERLDDDLDEWLPVGCDVLFPLPPVASHLSSLKTAADVYVWEYLYPGYIPN